MASHQFMDLPQFNMDESRYTTWVPQHYNYTPSYRHHDVHFSANDEMYFDEFDDGRVSMQPMDRFMHDQYPIAQGVLHAKYPVERHLPVPYEQYPSVDYYRSVSPDRTSASSTSNVTQNELRSPHTFHPMPYPTTEHLRDCSQLLSPTHLGGSVNLRQLEYEHHELESEPAMEDIETVDLKEDTLCDQGHTPVKMDTAASEGFREYADSGIGASVRDAEEVIPIDDIPENPASDDSDYSPKSSRSGTGKRRRSSATSNSSSNKVSKRRISVSKPTTAKNTKRPRHASNTTKKYVDLDDDRRPFPCPLAAYGCGSTFSSKNEWKRHVNTQHIKLGFWRCDLCQPTTDPNDDQTFYYNDFNRKDLFTQHLRRMHAAPKDNSHALSQKEFPVNEDNLPGHQTRCLRSLRTPPQHSICLFCDRTFEGPTSWEERMEHVGRHLEKDRNNGVDLLDVKSWNNDDALEQYYTNEGLIVKEQGIWMIGDGKPRRPVADDSDDESSEE